MLFSSLEFLCVFLPITLAVSFILPVKLQNYWLLAMSLLFYAWGEPTFVVFMLASIIFNYCTALLIANISAKGNGILLRRAVLAFSIAGNLSVLFVYKYMNFITGTILAIFPQANTFMQQTSFLLPIGISFFSFQAMSYVIDVYRGTPVQKNPAFLGLYISFFPQLIAGPIVRYTTIEQQINQRKVTPDSFSDGVWRFIIGFNKKILLANVLGEAADLIWSSNTHSVLTAWIGIISYTLQIYFDFSGYSDMAIGLGKLFGFHFLENFDYPYCSKSITEFWRRWHMSLGTWFRDYVYFPLGGSRVSTKWRMFFNLFVVWGLTGIWHGANWTFLLWGMLYGILIIIEKTFDIPRKLKQHNFWGCTGHVITLLAVMIGWVLFRSASITSATAFMQDMFGFSGNSLTDSTGIFYLQEYGITIMAGALCATPFFRFLKNRIEPSSWLTFPVHFTECLFQLLLFLVSISALVMNAHNPFIYFNF